MTKHGVQFETVQANGRHAESSASMRTDAPRVHAGVAREAADDPALRRVVMLVANEFLHDTRVYKQARSLVTWGCEVHVVAMARPDLPRRETIDEISIHRVEARSSRIWPLLMALPLAWCRPLFRRFFQPSIIPPLRRSPANIKPLKAPGKSAPASVQPKQQSRFKQACDHLVENYRGVWRLRIAYRLIRRAARIPVAALRRGWRFLKVRILGLPARAMRRIMPGAPALIGLNYDMARYALALKPVVIQSHDCNTLLAGALVKRLTGAPLVYDSHELFLERNIAGRSRWRDRLTWGPIEKYCIVKCDAVMSVADGICAHLAKQYGIRKPHLLRNVQPYEPPPSRSRLLSDDLGIPHDVAIVIYPGAITINRGLESLIDSAPHLVNAAYVIMGYARNAKYLAELKQRAQSLGVLGSKVHFRNAVPIDQVVRYTASADLGIVPTQNVCLSYSFEASNKIFHCLMAGVPLAMSDHPEKRLIAEQFGVGVLFDETDPRRIAAAVNSILADMDGHAQMKQRCLEAARVVNWQHEEQTLRRVFANVLGNAARPIPPVELPTEPVAVEVKSVKLSASVFDDADALRRLYAPPPEPSNEPLANFPLSHFEEFLQEIRRLEIEVITFADLFELSDDWDYRANYPTEFALWRKNVRDPKKRYLLIQHDVDNHPSFTRRMVAMEAIYGVRSNIFIFNERYSEEQANPPYDIDHEFFGEAEKRGFVIGYHQNALQLAGFELECAIERFRYDVAQLRKRYRIQFMVPHGGVGRQIHGVMHHNADVPLPPEFEGSGGDLRWAYNKYGATFGLKWSDGGLRKERDPKRIGNFDLIRSFLHQIKPGTRARCLIHPQRWGFNIDVDANPLLAREAWYRQLIEKSGVCTGNGEHAPHA